MARYIFPILLLILVVSPAYGLTVYDVIEMTEAELGDEVIINQIRASHSRFDLTVDEIIALSQAGVSDAVLSAMIATAFEAEESYYAYDYEDTYDDTRYVVVDAEPETRTYIHLGLGYYDHPWSYVWWDYWYPSWDYSWYAGFGVDPYWGWRYRPWHYRHYSCYWHHDWCRPRGWWHDDCYRYCSVNSRRDQVRWKSTVPRANITLAGSHTRTKAIRDANKGKTYSPLARLEPTRSKTARYGSALAHVGTQGGKVYKTYAQSGVGSKSRPATVYSRTKKSAVGQSVTRGPGITTRKTSRSSPGITRSKGTRSTQRTSPTIRSSPTRTKSSGSSPSVRSSRSKSSSGSSKATKSSRPSYRSSGSSKKSSPARSSGGSSSKSSGSSRSGGSKKRR